jgi:hypothetical protein
VSFPGLDGGEKGNQKADTPPTFAYESFAKARKDGGLA